MSKAEIAAKAVGIGLEAESRLIRHTVPVAGRRVIDPQTLEAAAGGLARTVDDVVGALTAQHAGAKRIFAEAEECFETVILNVNASKVDQARIQFELLHDRWLMTRKDLEKVLRQRAEAVEKLAAPEAKKHADDVLRQLDALFDSRYGYATWTTRVRYDRGPEEVRRIVREELAKHPSSAATIEEITDWAASLPFLQRPPVTPAKSPARGRELLDEFRRMVDEAKKAAGTPKGGVKSVDRATLAKQLAALDELARFHKEGDVLYDDIVDLVDEAFKKQKAAGGHAALTDTKFVDDLINKVQGRVGESLALRHPEFVERVWKPAQRTAEDLAARLNAKLVGVPPTQHFRVEIITEPVLATTAKGHEGQLLDSGIWLVRETPQGSVAMPVFGLEVKSGEHRSSIAQQVLDRARAQGGLVNLPGSGRRFTLTFPPKVEFESALASTRKITDKNMLGKLKDAAPEAERALGPGQQLITFRLPMTYANVRNSATACVTARLNTLRRVGP